MAKALQPPDSLHLTAAEGWLELGDWHAANEELEQISAPMRAHPDVLWLRHAIYAAAKKWDLAAEVARALSQLVPGDVSAFIQHAYALHELGRTQDAWTLLRPMAEKFPGEWLVAYNLACYACQLRDLKSARSWLGKAIDIAGAKDVKLLALEDKDLEPLWNHIAEI